MMFFPSSSKTISQNVSHNQYKKTSKNEKTCDDESEETYFSTEDQLRKIYGDGNKRYINSVSKFSKPKTMRTYKGKKLKGGFQRFLSNYGKTTHLVRFKDGVPQDELVDFDSLRGKYLVICCFDVPVSCMGAEKCRATIDAINDLSQSRDRDRLPFEYEIEFIVVANIQTKFDYDLKAAFYEFYSAFSCLAIPFTNFETRDYIHSCMSHTLNHDLAMLVDPDGVILYRDEVLDHFYYHGSFLPTTENIIDSEDEVLRSRFDPMSSPKAFRFQQPLSLYRDILLCDPSHTLRRFNPETDVDEFSTVVELSRKYVGLYLCINGSIMDEIKAAHDYCLANNQQFEIVLVCMSFYDEPKLYYEDLCKALRCLNIKSWFIFDYCSKICRRLYRIFGQGFVWPGEKFIIIPPNCESGELCGREVITNFGIKEYPFTRTAILKRRLEYVRSLTPVFSTLLNHGLIQKGKEFKSEQLQGKNVLLYLGLSESGLDHSLLKDYYPKIKAMGWEVVYVPLKYEDRYWNGEMVELDSSDYPFFHLQEMTWPCMLLSAADKASIKEKLIFPEDFKTRYIFAVKKDGKIVSRDVESRLDTDGVTESLFDDVLEFDLAYALFNIPLFDGGY